jgi:murein L,D-transpeptidase YafK
MISPSFKKPQPPRKGYRKWVILGLLLACGATGYWILVRMELLMQPALIPSMLCFNVCPPEQAVHPSIAQQPSFNPNKSLTELIGTTVEKAAVSILIEKSKSRLTVFYKLQPIKSYPVVFSTSPIGDKLAEGDRKTPEGIFHIRSLYPHPSWSKFMWIDYPTAQAWREHFQAKFSGKLSWSATIGGEVGIHGVPKGGDGVIDQKGNWTWGCISLKNADVNEVYEVTQAGTLLEILP